MSPEHAPRVLHVSQSDSHGGAAIAARRLHDALLAEGVDSRMAVIAKSSEDPRIAAPLGQTGRLRVRAARYLIKRAARLGARFAPADMRSLGLVPSGLGAAAARAGADIVHLHWVGSEAMSLGEIARLPLPLVWTMHDNWAFSGAHHLRPPEDRGAFIDVDRWTRRRKDRIWRDFKPTFVCPSAYTQGRLTESGAFPGARSLVIHNTLDTDAFVPVDRRAARAALGLPDGKLLLFGAVGGASDRNKGGDLLVETLAILRARGVRVSLAVFGGSAPDGIAQPVTNLGVLQGPAALAAAYSAADIFVCPSRIESLSNTVLEAQCCGTPAIGFASAGQVEAIGAPDRLAPPFDCAALASVVERLFAAPPDPQLVRTQTIARIGPSRIARQHMALYHELLAGRAGD